MKATGIIRRIDDLGRVVIPREIRRAVGIKDGDALEVFIDEQGVYFKRYNGQEEAMIHAFEPMRLALYKMGFSVGLYADDCHMAGRKFDDFETIFHSFGVWGGYEWAITYLPDEIALEGEVIQPMLNMMTASLKEVARELYGED